MGEIYLEIDSSKLQKALRLAPTQLRAEVSDTIDHISRSFFKKLYNERFKGPPGLRMGGRGNLFSRFRKRIIGNTSQEGTFSGRASSRVVTSSLKASSAATQDMGMEIYTDSPVAKIHEFGGTISPGHGMVIPFPGARLTKQGGKIVTKNLQVIKIGGRVLLGRKSQKGHKTDIVAIVENKITIRPRLGFYNTWGSMANQNIERLNMAISKALKKIQ